VKPRTVKLMAAARMSRMVPQTDVPHYTLCRPIAFVDDLLGLRELHRSSDANRQVSASPALLPSVILLRVAQYLRHADKGPAHLRNHKHIARDSVAASRPLSGSTSEAMLNRKPPRSCARGSH